MRREANRKLREKDPWEGGRGKGSPEFSPKHLHSGLFAILYYSFFEFTIHYFIMQQKI
jgi:hypothetical protein